MVLCSRQSLAASLLALHSGYAAAQNGYGSKNSPLPIVNLGYERQQANAFNESGNYYNFSNIRYAAPPLGERRFAAPHLPFENKTLQTGLPGRVCPQAHPDWENIAFDFLPRYIGGEKEFNSSSFASVNLTATDPRDPRETEDCLFLDVMAPKSIFDKAGKNYGAPVLVWIHGGGTTEGSKTASSDPAGLLRSSVEDGQEGIVYVGMNYRLGALGWQSGPTLQANGTANAGLHDQRMALEWVQRHISKFGGDPKRVTLMGESAGGGSNMLQATAYGGARGPVPFAQVISQSPGIYPQISNHQREDILNDFLAILNVSTIDEARKLPTEVLQAANLKQVRAADYGLFVYSETVDGDFVPAMPGELLARGQFDQSLRVMVGHNANEGLLFTSPFLQNSSAIEQYLYTVFPTLKTLPKVVDYILNDLYPPIFDGSQALNYTDSIGRANAIITEFLFTCNTHAFNKAFKGETHAYLFDVFPAIHGSDVPYTFFNGVTPDIKSVEVALTLQKYITNFVMTGDPNSAGVPYFPTWGKNATLHKISPEGTSDIMDDSANKRCDFWQKSLYY